MHTVLLLYRSVVLDAVTPDVSTESRDDGGGAVGGVGEKVLNFDIHATKRVDLREAETHGTNPADADSAEKISSNMLHAQPSVPGDVKRVAAQAWADVEAAADVAIKDAAGVGMDSGGDAEGGDCVVELGGGLVGCTGFTPEQIQITRDIAGQLDNEVRQKSKICLLVAFRVGCKIGNR